MAAINDNLQAVRTRIQAAARAAGREPASVHLLAVSKTFPPAAVEEAIAAGQRSFGENYVQEALDKMAALEALPGETGARRLQWHLIGPLQGNKTRAAAERFDWVHTLERQRTARRLSEARDPAAGPLNVLIQVNVSGEASKSGVPPAEAAALAREVCALPRLRLRGLMAIPAPSGDTSLQRECFRTVRQLFERLNSQGLALDTLSMGMSQDLEAAIAEGATMVRIGTAIFGARSRESLPRSPAARPAQAKESV